MSNILAIETATTNCSIALLTDGVMHFLENNIINNHTKTILPMVDQLLTNSKLKLTDLDVIAFDSGPGSFTGLRIGAGVAQGLSLVHNIPIVKISSLSAMAAQSPAPNIAIALDARMQEVYFGIFQNNSLLQDIKVLPIKQIELDPSTNWTLVGNGWSEYGVPKQYQHYPVYSNITPHAKIIANLALLTQTTTTFNAVPNYIRNI